MDRFARPALLVVAMQNDFGRVGAPLKVPQARDTIGVHRCLITTCRARDLRFWYLRLSYQVL